MSKIKRQIRIRKNIAKVSDRHRLSVFRSNKHIYAQVIDQKGNVLFGLTEKTGEKGGTTRIERSRELGVNIAKIALEKKIEMVVFDKGRFAYHGNVKAVAEGAREGGLKF
jgi:large subunit ribosomal protein L18